MKHILVVWSTHLEKELVFPNATRHFDTQEEAIKRAHYWLSHYPDDIVMTQTIETSVCKNCRVALQEIPGWVVHKWGHQPSLNRICFNKELTRAEPLEEAK